MAKARQKNRRAPYPPYARWLQLLAILKNQFPDRIDKSYIGQMNVNQATESMLQSALIFMGLVDSQRRPNKVLDGLVNSMGVDRKNRLTAILQDSYGHILKNLTLRTATPDQLAERFQTSGPNDEVGRKGLSFFVAMATEAELQMSPQISTRVRNIGERPQKNRRSSQTTLKATLSGASVPEKTSDLRSYSHNPINQMLDKFPDYEVSWNDVEVNRWRETIMLLIASLRDHPDRDHGINTAD